MRIKPLIMPGRYSLKTGDDANRFYIAKDSVTVKSTLTASLVFMPALVLMAVFGLATVKQILMICIMFGHAVLNHLRALRM
jgi:hypothetical protein